MAEITQAATLETLIGPDELQRFRDLVREASSHEGAKLVRMYATGPRITIVGIIDAQARAATWIAAPAADEIEGRLLANAVIAGVLVAAETADAMIKAAREIAAETAPAVPRHLH